MRLEDANALVVNEAGALQSFGGMISPVGVSVSHTVKIGGGSFTDGKRMETGLPEFMIDDNEPVGQETYRYQDGLYALKALTCHEYGHVWFTKFDAMMGLIDKIGIEMDAEGINYNLSRKVSQHFFNCTEDGRIETRMSRMYPGTIDMFRYLNGICWMRSPEEVPKQVNPLTGKDLAELNNFLACVCEYCVLGLRPKWYKNAKGTRLYDEFEKLPPILEKAVNASTCQKNVDATYEAIHAVWDYVLELLKELQEDQEAMEDFMNQLGDGDIQEGQDGAGDGTSAGDGTGSARLGEGENGGDPSDGSSSGSGESDGDEGQGAGAGKDGEGNDGNGAGKQNKDSKQPANKTGDNVRGARGGGVSGPQEKQAYDDTYEMSSGGGKADNGNPKTGGGSTKVERLSRTVEKRPKSPEELVTGAVKESKGLADKDYEAAKEAKKKATRSTKATKDKKSSSLSGDEIKTMEGSVGYDKEHTKGFFEVQEEYKMRAIDEHIRGTANQFKRKVERCFKEKNQLITKCNSGKLDTRQLYRLPMGEYNVFQKQANKSLADAVVEVCWDGSGSMHGGKQKYSAEACAIIEEGLKGLVPLKIVNFTVDWHRGSGRSAVVHYLVKDFDDNRKDISYTQSYSYSKGFSGGNKDGYSIRVCTEELLKRGEKDKILIVLSDGLPSDYSYIRGEDDVKDAVKQARKKGVTVIPIFFGDDYFRNDEDTLREYEYMYERHIINAAPEELPNKLVKLFEQLVLR